MIQTTMQFSTEEYQKIQGYLGQIGCIQEIDEGEVLVGFLHTLDEGLEITLDVRNGSREDRTNPYALFRVQQHGQVLAERQTRVVSSKSKMVFEELEEAEDVNLRHTQILVEIAVA